MSLLLTFLLASCGFLALASAMPRHQRDLFGRSLSGPGSRVLRWLGWSLLGVSALPLIAIWGVATAVAIWLALLSLAALAVVSVLSAQASRTGKAG